MSLRESAFPRNLKSTRVSWWEDEGSADGQQDGQDPHSDLISLVWGNTRQYNSKMFPHTGRVLFVFIVSHVPLRGCVQWCRGQQRRLFFSCLHELLHKFIKYQCLAFSLFHVPVSLDTLNTNTQNKTQFSRKQQSSGSETLKLFPICCFSITCHSHLKTPNSESTSFHLS